MKSEMFKRLPELILIPLEYTYNKLPMWIKNGRRYFKIYNKTLMELKSDGLNSNDEINKIQFRKLKELLIYSYENVKYYKNLFDSINFNPYNMQNIKDIEVIPYLTKDIINENFDDLVSIKYDKKKLKKFITGGSTGEPFQFYIDKVYDGAREKAFIDYLFNEAGYNNNLKTVILRGDKVRKIEYKSKKNVYWKKRYGTNEVIFSSYHINSSTIKYYINKINEFKPECIKAYPSSLELLCEFCKEMNIKINTIKLIILASENIYSEQRKIFKDVFPHAKIYSFYGHAEHSCIAGECKESSYYHFEPKYGYVEFREFDKYSNEIICTGFNNYVMPFIRYCTGDLTEKELIKECSCLKPYTIIKSIKGRCKEYIIDKDNNKIILTGSYKILNYIKDSIFEGQLYQDTPGIIELRLRVKDNFTDEDKKIIIKKFNEQFNDITVDVTIVNEMQKTHTGKQGFLIQKL